MTISLAQFQELSLNIGKVVAADVHPNADRLLVLHVEVGAERRQLVAGIRQHYAPETLVGRLVVVVTNLEPATIRGVESQGMLLAAHDDQHLAILIPDRDVASGAAIR